MVPYQGVGNSARGHADTGNAAEKEEAVLLVPVGMSRQQTARAADRLDSVTTSDSRNVGALLPPRGHLAAETTTTYSGGACAFGARCLVSSVTTNPSHVGHHTRTQGAPTSVGAWEKGTLVVELSSGYVWTLRGPPGEAIHRFGPCFS
ncbi:hypothetical protein HPB47_008731 [Ixodes persulcatus]|uniref:Uncharacterized protein n=1 Tax=Ixodes persulcatus TaxID=34615 RepID=A0AC60P469_IXOPE|nr:hypothetical protein HPB47_008731 [Ixodes persulcatus]